MAELSAEQPRGEWIITRWRLTDDAWIERLPNKPHGEPQYRPTVWKSDLQDGAYRPHFQTAPKGTAPSFQTFEEAKAWCDALFQSPPEAVATGWDLGSAAWIERDLEVGRGEPQYLACAWSSDKDNYDRVGLREEAFHTLAEAQSWCERQAAGLPDNWRKPSRDLQDPDGWEVIHHETGFGPDGDQPGSSIVPKT